MEDWFWEIGPEEKAHLANLARQKELAKATPTSITDSWEIELRECHSLGRSSVICISSNGRLWTAQGIQLPSISELRKRPPTYIPQEQGTAIYDLVRSVSVTPFPTFALGVDGTTYMLSLSAGFNSVCYKWWGKLPDEWADLNPAASSLMKLADAAFGVEVVSLLPDTIRGSA
jgi:hypothetical protein